MLADLIEWLIEEGATRVSRLSLRKPRFDKSAQPLQNGDSRGAAADRATLADAAPGFDVAKSERPVTQPDPGPEQAHSDMSSRQQFTAGVPDPAKP